MKPHWPLKPNALGAHLPGARPPGCGEPDMGLRTLTPVGEPLQYNYSSVCGLPSWGLWDFIISRVHPSYPSHCGFFFMSLVVEDLF